MRNIRDDIKNGTFRQTYLLYGEEEYLKSQYRDLLLKALVPDRDSMNYNHYAGKDVDEGTIISQAETMPFFADRRVIVIEDSGLFKKKSEKLADYMAELPDYLVMIFVESEVDKRNRLFKAVGKSGRTVVFDTQNEETLTRWILQRMGKEGKKITRNDMQHFLEVTGTDMANINSELEKLLAYTMDSDVITGEDIDAVCAPQISNKIFEMVRAVAEHRQKEALDYYYDLLALKEPPMRILYFLAKEFNMLLVVKTMAVAGFANREIASKIGRPPFVVSKSMGLIRNYTSAQLENIVRDFTDMEEAVKTGRMTDTVSVEMMIVKYSA
uniref:DNA polymerase III subunit delta n=1 Tax=Eubacterium cellulosolvens TaxID=29322 RepID=UPI00048278CC|nr:DNA polymerase III subunit delta [[Eubacterium] cellulosolvens]